MERKEVINILESYFEGLFENDVESIPLDDDVKYSGPMVTSSLEGREKVYEFLSDVAGAFVNVQYHTERDIVDGNHVCSVLKLRLSGGQILEMCTVFEIVNSKIKSIQSFYDPRAMTE
jgi:hypothetical protein